MKTLISITAALTLSIMLHAQSTGTKISGDFNTIDVNSVSTVNIIQSDSDIVSVESGDNSGIRIEDGVLRIRPSVHVTCNVRIKDLKSLKVRDAATVKSENTLNVDDLKISQADASTVTLSLNAKSVEAVTKDASTLKLSGTTDNLDISANDASTVKTSELKASSVIASANDAARIKTDAENKITARATGSGVIKYSGNPTEKNVTAADAGSVKTDDGTTVITGSAETGNDNDTEENDDSTYSSGFDHSFQDAFIGGGFVLGPDQKGAFVKYGNSREFNFGFGGGYKFCRWNGIGADIYYKSTDFFLVQDSTKKSPNTTLHNSEKVSFNNLGGLVFDRFFIGKMFFDGGIYYDWIFHTRHVAWDDYTTPNIAGASSTKITDRDLAFANPSDYGLRFRIGTKEGFCIYFNYRMSNLIKDESGATYGPTELPPYVLGINIGGF